jgi:hypothetical protein
MEGDVPVAFQSGSGVAGLYWAFHRLLRSLFADKKQSDAAEALARHLYF